MIDKQTFIKIITKLKEYMERVSKIEDTLNCVFNFSTLDDVVVELLEKLTNAEVDQVYSSTLSWWIYDLNFGKDWEPDSLIVDGESIDLSTAEKLYDFLTT